MIPKLIKTILLHSFFFISIHSFYGQKTEVIPSTIKLTKYGLDTKSISISGKDGVFSEPIFKFGQYISINLEKIKGLTKIDDRYYPNVDLTLVSKKGDTIFYKPNRQGIDYEVKGITKNSLNIPLFPYYPMLLINGISSGEEYTLLCVVRDTKSKNSLNIEIDFKVLPNPNPHLLIKKEGLDYSEGFLFSYRGQRLLTDNIVTKNEYLILTFTDIQGYTVKDDKLIFNIEYMFTNELDEILFQGERVLTSKCEKGKVISPIIEIPFEISKVKDFDSSIPLILNIKISERYSDKQIKVSTKLFVNE